MTEDLLAIFGVWFFTPIKRRMKNRLLPFVDKLLLRKRVVIESMIDPLKHLSQIDHPTIAG